MRNHDKKIFFLSPGLVLLVAFISLFAEQAVLAQMGPGMQGRCPMCGQDWDGRYANDPAIPENLPKPENENWLNQLEDILNREKLSREQYQRDAGKFNLHMPYMRVIPDEVNHITWIERLFKAYEVPFTAEVPPIKDTGSPSEAYRVARELERELVPDYEWLVQNAPDSKSRQVIEIILFQTRMHYTMFDHALSMGGMMGPGR